MDKQSEQSALVEAAGRLSDLFPSVDRDSIDRIMQEEYVRFADARVRDFVPNLTEHAATDRLREIARAVPPVAPATVGEFRPVDAEISLDPYEVEARSEQTGQLSGELRNN